MRFIPWQWRIARARPDVECLRKVDQHAEPPPLCTKFALLLTQRRKHIDRGTVQAIGLWGDVEAVGDQALKPFQVFETLRVLKEVVARVTAHEQQYVD